MEMDWEFLLCLYLSEVCRYRTVELYPCDVQMGRNIKNTFQHTFSSLFFPTV